MSIVQTARNPGVARPADRGPARWPLLFASAVIAVACLPPLIVHAIHLWEKPHYQFFPVVPLAAGLLAYRAAKDLGPLQPGSRRRVALLLGTVWLLLLTAALIYSPWIAAVAALVLVATGIYALGGGVLFRRLLPAWIVLWLVVPLPMKLDDKLVTGMQLQAAHVTSGVLVLIGVYHFMSGTVIEVPGQKLMVEQACSGAQSLFAVFFCTLVFIFWNRYGVARSLWLLAAASFWVLLANIARLVAVAWLGPRWQVDLSTGWRHEVLGWILFLVTLFLIWSSDQVFAFGAEVRAIIRYLRTEAVGLTVATTAKESGPRRRNPTQLPDLRVVPVPWFAAAAFAALAVVQIGCFWPRHFLEFTGQRLVERMESVDENALPGVIGPWQFVKFETKLRPLTDREGEHSRIWRYQAGRVSAAVSLDYPFKGWHELPLCYQSFDWQLEPPAEGELVADPEDNYAMSARFKKPLGRSAYLWFASMDESGRPLPPPPDPGRVKQWFDSRAAAPLGAWFGREAPIDAPQRQEQQTYQVQVFVESYSELTAQEETQVRDLFHLAYAELKRLSAPKP